ncbi:hypothetical protein [Bradyrhizobium sp. SZCCHNR1093]|uniref:hypothetical protein n=1 Tax=Bradyrhizobium sp. SZCCHNR1093 TaxID=3057368 RepID=UPI0028E89B1B|nr:hypothetical protein [Bradyrhizobium sp. SZCCHNR1093]
MAERRAKNIRFRWRSIKQLHDQGWSKKKIVHGLNTTYEDVANALAYYAAHGNHKRVCNNPECGIDISQKHGKAKFCCDSCRKKSTSRAAYDKAVLAVDLARSFGFSASVADRTTWVNWAKTIGVTL